MNIEDLIKRGEMRRANRDKSPVVERSFWNFCYKIYRCFVKTDECLGCFRTKIRDWRRGYSDDDVLDLNTYIVNKVRNPLVEFVTYEAEGGFTLPAEFKTDQAAWLAILQKIEYSFESSWREKNDWANRIDRNMTKEQKEEHSRKVQEGFELFGKHFQSLWD